MNRIALLGLGLVGVSAVGCSESDFPTNTCSAATTDHCVEVAGGDSEAFLEAVNSAEPSTTIILGTGTFHFPSTVSISQNGIHIVGQGISKTTLDFAGGDGDGISAVSNDFLVQDFTLRDSAKDGIRVASSIGVVFRRIRVTWTNVADMNNGPYGIYPVISQNVLVEDSFAENASDAGLYVGQCQHVIVRRNTVLANVAGLEIENTQYADVYENVAEDNTGGIVVFDMQLNPIVGRDVRLYHNEIRRNNGPNFASGGTVKLIPPGTGTFALASRRVEIFENEYEDNNTVDIAILNGFVIDSNPANWAHTAEEMIGDWDDLGLYTDGAGTYFNFRTDEVVIRDNTFVNGGVNPSRHGTLGLLLNVMFPGEAVVPNIVYDSIGETTFDATTLANNTNDNHICLGGNQSARFGSLDLASQEATLGMSPFLVVEQGPFGAFDCTALSGAPIAPVELASAGD